MMHAVQQWPTIAVFPVLVGPLQTLLALLPAILLGLGSMLLAALKPAGFAKLMRFFWRQKFFLAAVAIVVLSLRSGWATRLLSSDRPDGRLTAASSSSDWPCLRGDTRRLGRGLGDADPTSDAAVWTNRKDKTVFSSPAVAGDRIVFSTATDIGPFSPEGRGAVVCIEAHSGRELWRYSPSDYRATFSSPVVHGRFVICGEGLHQVSDARVTCLDVESGEKLWEFRTASHVESTAAIADGRVFIGAGDDGFYCLSLQPKNGGESQVEWHLAGKEFPDCESSPIVQDGVVYWGLGEGGSAICAAEADSGKVLWKLDTPYPVFAPMSIANGKLFVSTGNGNFVQSAADLLEMKLQILRDDGATEEQLSAARDRLKPIGEVWCVDLATRQIDWKFRTADAILGAIVCGEDAVYFGSRDGHLYRVSLGGELLQKFDLHKPLISSPALGAHHVYCATADGRLYGFEAKSLKPIWDVSLGSGETFTSSPTLAHGHVYIGTANDGLRCVGEPGEPAPPLWNVGEVGGPADDVSVPELLAVLWQFPSDPASAFQVTAPLMPLGEAIYAIGQRGDSTELIRMDVDHPAVRDTGAGRVRWNRSLEGATTIAPVGVGRRLCLVEASADQKSAKLVARSVADGAALWRVPIPGTTRGLTVNQRFAYVASGDQGLQCRDLFDGTIAWHDDSSHTLALAVADDILIEASSQELRARDAATGAELWRRELAKGPARAIVIDGHSLRVSAADQDSIFSVIDGQRGSDGAIPSASASWMIPTEAGTRVTPLVSLKGRVYLANDRGKIVCLEAEQP